MSSSGVARWNLLKKATFKHYEEGAKAFSNREEWLWTGDDIIMALRYDEGMEMGSIYVRSESIRGQMILK